MQYHITIYEHDSAQRFQYMTFGKSDHLVGVKEQGVIIESIGVFALDSARRNQSFCIDVRGWELSVY
jgi:hypothetical protein